MGGWQWTCDGERVAWINLRAETDRLRLTYRVRLGGDEWEDVPRPSLSSASPAASVGRDRISSAPVW
jgi:hypothetical protein